VFILNNWLTSI